MKLINVIAACLAVAGFSAYLLHGNEELGAEYNHFLGYEKLTPAHYLHLSHAFYTLNHLSENQKLDLVNSLKKTITDAQVQSSSIGNMISETETLYSHVKTVKEAISDPSTYAKKGVDAIKGKISKLFNRLLADSGEADADGFLNKLELKIKEARGNQKDIEDSLIAANKGIDLVLQAKELFSDDASMWQKTKSFFGFSLAQMESNPHFAAGFAEDPIRHMSVDYFKDRERSLRINPVPYEGHNEEILAHLVQADTQMKVKRMLKKVLRYLNKTPEPEFSLTTIEHQINSEDLGYIGDIYKVVVQSLADIKEGKADYAEVPKYIKDEGECDEVDEQADQQPNQQVSESDDQSTMEPVQQSEQEAVQEAEQNDQKDVEQTAQGQSEQQNEDEVPENQQEINQQSEQPSQEAAQQPTQQQEQPAQEAAQQPNQQQEQANQESVEQSNQQPEQFNQEEGQQPTQQQEQPSQEAVEQSNQQPEQSNQEEAQQPVQQSNQEAAQQPAQQPAQQQEQANQQPSQENTQEPVQQESVEESSN